MPIQYSKIFCISLIFLLLTQSVFAETVDELKAKIANRNDNIAQLEAEIKRYITQIETLGKQANTLQNTLAELELSRKKLGADLKVTQNKIEATNLEIERLRLDINAKQGNIDEDRTIIAQSLNKLYQSGSTSVIQTILEMPAKECSLKKGK